MRIEDEYTASMAQMRAALRPRWPKSAAPFSACARSTRSSVSDSLVPTVRCKRCVLPLGVDSLQDQHHLFGPAAAEGLEHGIDREGVDQKPGEVLGDEPGEEGNEVRNHVLSGRCLFRSAPRVRRVRSRTGIVSLSA